MVIYEFGGSGGNVITMGKSKELAGTPAAVRLRQPQRLCDERLASNLPQTLLFRTVTWYIMPTSFWFGRRGERDIANYWAGNHVIKSYCATKYIFVCLLSVLLLHHKKKNLTKTRIKLYNTLALPVLLYGSEIWTINPLNTELNPICQ